MRCGKGIVFSLDAFVSFAIILLCLQSLLFLYARPPSYLDRFVSLKILSADTLHTLASLNASEMGVVGFYADKPLLYYIVDYATADLDVVKAYFDPIIPEQFGYRLEYRKNNGEWNLAYDSAKDASQNGKRPQPVNFMNVSSVVSFFVKTQDEKGKESCYAYNTCSGEGTVCDFPVSFYKPPVQEIYEVRLVIYR